MVAAICPTAGAIASRTSGARSGPTKRTKAQPIPDARLYRKGDGRESRLCYMGHAVMENRNGLAICGEVTHATGTAEREVVLAWLDERPPRRLITLGGDKATMSSTLSKLSKSAMSRRILPSMARSVGTALRAKQPSTDAPLAIPILCDQPVHPQADRGDLRLGKIDRRTRPAQGPRHREGEDHLRPWAGRPMSTFRDHAVANRAARLPQERARTAIGRKRRRLPVSICGACGARMGRARSRSRRAGSGERP